MDTLEAVVKFGQHAPENSSTNGNRPGLSKNWATPQAFDCVNLVRSPEKLQQTRIEKKAGCMNLREQVHYPNMNHSRKSWPTPDCSDRRSANSKQQGLSNVVKDNWRTPKIKLRDHVNHNISDTGKKKLNPAWVEALMGVPSGWTQLSGVTDPNENRIDRLRLLGNGVVPATAAKAFSTLIEEG